MVKIPRFFKKKEKEPHEQAHVSAPQKAEKKSPGVQGPHEKLGGEKGFKCPPQKGAPQADPLNLGGPGVPGESGRFGRFDRIRLNREVEKVLREGKSLSGGLLKLAWIETAKRGSPSRRIAIRVPHKFGNAVKRNRARRLLREVFRRNRGGILEGSELVVSFKAEPAGRKLSYGEVDAEFKALLRKAGIWSDE